MKLHAKKFTIDQFFYILLSVSLIIAITIVSLAPALLDWIDQWFDNMMNQIRFLGFVTGIMGIFAVRWAVKFLKRI